MKVPAPTRFVQAVMDRLGASGNTELAKVMRWEDYNAPSNIGRWRRGTSAPSYEATMEMLDKCGWLNMDADPQMTAAPATPADAHLEEIAKTLKVLAQNQAIALDALGVPEAERLPVQPPAAPKRARPKRK